MLADRALKVGAPRVALDVESAFRDPDGDVLTYAVESSAPDVVLASAADRLVTLAPLAAGEAIVTVTATDLEGSSRTATQTFTVAVTCAFAVDPLHRDTLWTAGTERIAVTTVDGCAWEATSESGFLTVTSRAAGTGPGMVTYTVAANADGPRTGVLLVAGERVTVFQASSMEFADHPIEPGVTPVKAIHILELRARIDALRADAGLAAFEWRDSELTAGVTPVRSFHVTELREALAGAYVAGGRSAPGFMNAPVTERATVIRAEHLMALRAAVAALE